MRYVCGWSWPDRAGPAPSLPPRAPPPGTKIAVNWLAAAHVWNRWRFAWAASLCICRAPAISPFPVFDGSPWREQRQTVSITADAVARVPRSSGAWKPRRLASPRIEKALWAITPLRQERQLTNSRRAARKIRKLWLCRYCNTSEFCLSASAGTPSWGSQWRKPAEIRYTCTGLHLPSSRATKRPSLNTFWPDRSNLMRRYIVSAGVGPIASGRWNCLFSRDMFSAGSLSRTA